MNRSGIRDHILELENELLKVEVRKSKEKINQLLTDDFTEFCSNGVEYHYTKGDAYASKDDYTELNWKIIDFNTKKLSEDCILALFKVIKHNEEDINKKYSLRSSIWKLIDGKWKMFFHQGTNTSIIPGEDIIRK